MENKDYVLILEKSGSSLKTERKGGDYYLEGIAAVFGKENSNARIYEENEYLPHLEYLKEKMLTNRLVGELDHPKDFDISLKNISHVIEDLNYNEKDRTIRIKVKLLDTPAGKIARSLVDAGIPISISSRAAGNVLENKRVQIKKIFTYDLVADPGFPDAQLERVYESLTANNPSVKTDSLVNTLENINENLGLGKNSNFQIYRIKDYQKIEKILKESSNKTLNMDKNFVTADELNDYSVLLQKEMDSLKSQIASIKVAKPVLESDGATQYEARIAKLEKYCDYLAENLEASVKYGDYLAENLEGAIGYGKYLAENLDKSISYSKYLAEHVDNGISYGEYLAEHLDNNILQTKEVSEGLLKTVAYTNYLAENIDKNISYAEYLAEHLDSSMVKQDTISEKLNKTVRYTKYLAENVDRGISYAEYLAENLDQGLAYADYLGENLDKGIRYSEYLGEKLSSNIGYSQYIAESVNKIKGKSIIQEVSESVKTGQRTSGFSGDYTNLNENIDNLINTVKKQKTEEVSDKAGLSFLKLLDERTQKGFLSLNEAEKQKAVKALNEQDYESEKDVVRIIGTALTEQNSSGEKFLDMMPSDLVPVWESLQPIQKAAIIAQAKLSKVETPYQINHFWRTRGMEVPKANLQKLDNAKTETQLVNESKVYSKGYLESIASQIGQKFGQK